MLRAVASVLVAVVALAGCDGDAPPSDPYRVIVDVGPQIRTFGEDTASADEAGDQLAALGVPAVPALAAALQREPRDVRQKAVEVLAAIGAPETLPPLLDAARGDADPDVRADALRALGALGDARARPLLEATLADPDLTVRVGAVMGCATLCTSADAVARLTQIALDPTQPPVALAARTTLLALRARGGDVAATAERARAAAGDPATPAGRALAALLASDVDPGAAQPALVAALPGSPPMLQRQLLWRLGALGDAAAVPAMAALFASEDAAVRLYVCDALAKLRDRGVVPAAAALDGYAGPRPRGPMPPPEF